MAISGHGLRNASDSRARAARAALLASVAAAPLLWPAMPASSQAPQPAPALPTGGRVVAGGATIAAPSPDQLRITQTTPRAAIDWQSFSVGQGGHVQFQQPSASAFALNRVTGPDASVIAGRITANGQIAIVNQSGVVFTPTARVDAAGLIASAAGITNDNFMAGRMVFDAPPRPGATVVNEGRITIAEGGLAALVAPQAANRGTIEARLGRVVIGGAETYALDLHGDGLLSLEVRKPAAVTQGPAASNTGTIAAEGGTVLITAEAAGQLVQSLVEAGGTISARNGGRVAVAAPGGEARVVGAIDAGSAAGRGGEITVTGRQVAVSQAARIDASGGAGGGRVRLGGDVQGGGATPRAERTTVAQGATVRADATVAGDGGTVVVWADDAAFVHGALSARGGPRGGAGGFIETSGLRTLSLAGISVDAGAPAGPSGTWLIDPFDLTIGVATANGSFINGIFTPAPGANAATLSASDLATALETTNVTLTTAGGGSGAGNITVAQPVFWGNDPDFPATTTLTLDAVGQIVINAAIYNPVGSLVLNAGPSHSITQSAAGTITVSRLAATAGRDITLASTGNGIGEVTALASATGSISLASGSDLSVTGAVSARLNLTLAAPDISTAPSATLSAGPGQTLTLRANTLALAAEAAAPAGRIVVLPFSPNRGMTVGGSAQQGATLNVTQATLGRLRTDGGTLQLGGGAGTGAITIVGATTIGGTQAATLDLRSAAAVTQSAPLTAGRLLVSGATVALDDPANAVATLGPSASTAGGFSFATTTAGAPFTVESAIASAGALSLANGSGALSLAVPLAAPGAVTLAAQGGITQAAGAGISAPSLTASVTGAGASITLTSPLNTVATLAGASVGTGGGGIAFATSSALTVNGAVSAPGAIAITTPGTLQVSGTISGGTVSLGAGGALGLAGAVTAATAVSLTAAGTIAQTAAGAITAPALTAGVTGSGAIDLGNAPNAVDRLSGVTIAAGGGPLAFATTTALAIDGPVIVPGAARLSAGGGLTQTARIVATSLSVSAGAEGLVLDRADNAFGALAGAAAAGGPVAVAAAADLVVSGTVAGTEVTLLAGGALATLPGAAVTASALARLEGIAGLSLGAAVSGADVRLASAGAVVTLPGAGVSASGTATVTAGTGVNLGADLAGAGGVSVAAGTTVFTRGLAAGDGDVTVTAPGNVTIGGAVSARDVTVGSGATLTSLAGATIAAGRNAALSATAGVSLAGPVSGLEGVSVTAAGGISTASVSSASGDIAIRGASVSTGGTVEAGPGRTLAITADAIEASAPLRAAGGTVSLAPRGAGATVWLGGPFGPGLVLSGVTLSRVDAGSGTLAIGGATAGPVFQTQALNLVPQAATLSLTGTSVTQIAPLATSRLAADTGGGPISLAQGGNAIAALGPVRGGAVSLATAGALLVEGPVAAGTLALAIGGAVTQTATATIATARLSGSAGSLALDGSAHAIGTLGPFAAGPGGLALATAGPLALAGAISTPGTLALAAGGQITAAADARLTAGLLRGGASGGTALDGAAHAIASLGPWTDSTGGFALRTSGPLSVTGALSLGGPLALAVGGGLGVGAEVVTTGALSVTAAGPVTLAGDVSSGAGTSLRAAGPVALGGALSSGGTLAIEADAPVTQAAGSRVTAPILSGRSAGGAAFAQPGNAIGQLGPWQDFFGGLAVQTTGALALAGPVTLGTTLVLGAGTTITQAPGAPVTASRVLADAADGVALTAGGNRIGVFGPVSATAGDVRIVNLLPVVLDGPVTAAGTLSLVSGGVIEQRAPVSAARLEASGSGGITLRHPANAIRSAGDVVDSGGAVRLATTTGIALDGRVASATAVDLRAGGAVTQGPAGRVETPSLSGASSGGASLDNPANSVARLAGWRNAGGGGFRYVGAGGLAVTAPVDAGTGPLAIETRGGGTLSLGADLASGTAIAVTSAGALSAGDFVYSAPAIAFRSLGTGQEMRLAGGTFRAADRVILASSGDMTLTGTMLVQGLPAGSRPTIVLSVRSGTEPTGFVRPDSPGLPDLSQPTQIEDFAPPTGQARNRLSLGAGGISAPASALFLVVDGGSATGTIDVARLGLVILRGATDLSGCVNGVCGPNAASLGRTTDASAEARLNNCPVSSPNCLNFANTVNVVSSQPPAFPALVTERAASALEIPLADVSDEEE